MVRIENHCCGCAVPAYPCLGSRCPNRRVEVHYCDRCGTELDEDYEGDEELELCESCRDELDNDNEFTEY